MDLELREERRRVYRGAIIVLAFAVMAILVLLVYLVVSLSQSIGNVD